MVSHPENFGRSAEYEALKRGEPAFGYPVEVRSNSELKDTEAGVQNFHNIIEWIDG